MRYGSFTHDPGEVNLVTFEIVPNRSSRNLRMTRTVRMHLVGEVIAPTDTADADIPGYITTRIDAIKTAYADDYQDAVYEIDTTGSGSWSATPHALYNNSDCVSGVMVKYRSWPKGDPAEYATVRTFSITLEAEYRDVYSEILEFRESLRYIGTSGPTWEWVVPINGFPQQRWKTAYSLQQIIQKGHALGLDGYPLAVVPGPLLPNYEHTEQRVFDLHDPQNRGRAYLGYGVTWQYVMTSPVGQTLFPHKY